MLKGSADWWWEGALTCPYNEKLYFVQKNLSSQIKCTALLAQFKMSKVIIFIAHHCLYVIFFTFTNVPSLTIIIMGEMTP
jgi:hypothetical protein